MLSVILRSWWRHSRDKHIVHLLSEYIDGRLPDRDRAMVDGHLLSCPSCRGELESLKATVSLLKSLPSLNAPRSFLLASSSQRAAGIYRSPVVARALMGTVASFLIVSLIGVFLFAYYPVEVAVPSKDASAFQALQQTTVAEAPTPAPALRGLEVAPGPSASSGQAGATPQAQREGELPPAVGKLAAKEGPSPEGSRFPPLHTIGLWMFFGGLVGGAFLLVAGLLLVRRQGEF